MTRRRVSFRCQSVNREGVICVYFCDKYLVVIENNESVFCKCMILNIFNLLDEGIVLSELWKGWWYWVRFNDFFRFDRRWECLWLNLVKVLIWQKLIVSLWCSNLNELNMKLRRREWIISYTVGCYFPLFEF